MSDKQQTKSDDGTKRERSTDHPVRDCREDPASNPNGDIERDGGGLDDIEKAEGRREARHN